MAARHRRSQIDFRFWGKNGRADFALDRRGGRLARARGLDCNLLERALRRQKLAESLIDARLRSRDGLLALGLRAKVVDRWRLVGEFLQLESTAAHAR